MTLQSIVQFVTETLPRFRKFFPAYESRPLYPVLAALHIEAYRTLCSGPMYQEQGICYGIPGMGLYGHTKPNGI